MEKTAPMAPMHIAFCSDSNYAMPTGIAMISICENNRDIPIVFHLVLTDEGEPKEKQDAALNPLKDIAIRYGKQLNHYSITADRLSPFVCVGVSHVSTTAFARLFLPDILASDIPKLLYLDGDLIVTQSLKDLWETQFPANCPLAAVPDYNMNLSYVRHNSLLPEGVIYFNSGVLLMNLDLWREEHLSKQIVDVAGKYKFPFLDQDAINYTLQNRILRLSFTYNGQVLVWHPQAQWRISVDMQTYDEICRLKESNSMPVILHYITANKPWKQNECLWREEWNKYRRLSIWKDLKLPLVTSFERSKIYPAFIDAYWGDPELMQLGVKLMLPFYYACLHFKNKRRILDICFSPIKCITWILENTYKLKVKMAFGR